MEKILQTAWGKVVVFLFFFLLVTVAYFPALGSTFILDDYVWIQPLTTSDIWHLFIGSWEHGNTLRPIMRLEFFLTRILFDEVAWLWHMVNVLFHSAVTFCGYLFLYRVTKRQLVALLAAVLFAIFPSNHETVAWISGITHPFGLLLSLGSGIALYYSCTKKKHTLVYGVSGFIMLLAAFLTYEVSFALPFILLGVVYVVGPRTKYSYAIIGCSFLLLGFLVLYRMQVLGGSVGSIAQHHENIVLGSFLNFRQIVDLFWYSKELKLVWGLLCLIAFVSCVRYKPWEKSNNLWRVSLVLFFAAILSYMPFSVVRGVAPRFLYSSLFFFILGMGTVYVSLAEAGLSMIRRRMVIVFVSFLLVSGIYRTWEVATRYQEVGNAYTHIIQTVKTDFPIWPNGKGMVFFGIPNSHENILAFLTYFDLAIQRAYVPERTGPIYRAERLSAEEFKKILSENPIQYEFQGFDKGLRRIQ